MSEELLSLLEKAIALAKKAHAGQIDKAGKPYINHPLRVMTALEGLDEKIVGVLHDTIEDSDLTLADLDRFGFPDSIIQAIDSLSKRPQENYDDYLTRVMGNPLALKVKIADMTDNANLNRIANPTERDYQRQAKYIKTLPKLRARLEAIGDRKSEN
ncbi:MAG: GTP pyrophosphokinase [Cyanobacteria bacterium SBLK]|nr:GTP pyrophosphokinase [Cyanobacteria bacterium SBLK]